MQQQQIRKVLAVDDDTVQLAVVGAWLSSAGFEVIQHGSPIGTTQLVITHRPDLILVDWDMPILAGPEMVEILVKRVAHIPIKVVFYSGKPVAALEGLVSRSSAAVLGAIRKTHDGPLFLSQLSQLLASKAAQAGAGAQGSGERRAATRVRPADNDPVHVWITTPKGEFRLQVGDLSIASGQSRAGMRLRVTDPVAREALASPGTDFPAMVQLPPERTPAPIQVSVVWVGPGRSEPDPSRPDQATWISVTYRIVSPADEARFQRFFARCQAAGTTAA